MKAGWLCCKACCNMLPVLSVLKLFTGSICLHFCRKMPIFHFLCFLPYHFTIPHTTAFISSVFYHIFCDRDFYGCILIQPKHSNIYCSFDLYNHITCLPIKSYLVVILAIQLIIITFANSMLNFIFHYYNRQTKILQ